MATANLMEMKELATRQKLRELKEAMASGKSFIPAGALNGDTNGHGDAMNDSRVTDNGGLNKSMNNGNETLHNSSLVSNSKVPNNDFYAKKKSEKDPTSKWETNYTRPTTPKNLTFQNDVNKSHQTDPNEGRVSFDVPEKAEKENNEAKEKKKQILTADDMLEIQSKKLEREISYGRSRKSREQASDQRTYIPSEYVHGTNKDQFDARKMNLSAKNFDTALNSMLGQENAKMAPDNTDYEQYARTSKYQPNPYLEAQRPTRPRTQSQRGQRSRKDRYREGGSAEGQRMEREPAVSCRFF